MGHRANFVVIEGNAAKAYYDQWAALGCIYTFADGLKSAMEAFSAMEITNELLDWAYAEGGYLLDFDERLAIVFGVPFDDFEEESEGGEGGEGGEGDGGTPLGNLNSAIGAGWKEYLTYIAPAWSGWKLIWDDRGVDAFSEHLRSRGITSIITQPNSHPDTVDVSEIFQA